MRHSALFIIFMFSLSAFMPTVIAQESQDNLLTEEEFQDDLITGDFIRSYQIIRPAVPKLITESVVGPAGTPIYEMKIDVTRTILQARIDVRSLDPEEAGLDILPGGVVLSYINISAKNLDNSDLERLDIKFRVPTTWMEDNKIAGAQSVKMLRLNPGAWIELETSIASGNEEFLFYETHSESFGIFVVVGENLVPLEQETVDTEMIGEQPEIIEVESGEDFIDNKAREELAVIVAVLIVAVTIGILFLLPGSVLRRKVSRR